MIMRRCSAVFFKFTVALILGSQLLFAASAMGRDKPGVEMKFLGANSDYIIANEKKFKITPATKVLNSRGDKTALRYISQGTTIHIEYFVDERNNAVATLIKVVSSSR
ncbi:MAG: hypothetical protein IEMM0002_1208 [bacterium]|nr:MAG: hypothetical protein IEMM0002_1208 [bacterium]